MRGRGSLAGWKSAKPRDSERWRRRTRGSRDWWPTKPCRFISSKRSTQKSGEPVCKTAGGEDECARRSWQSSSGLSGAGTGGVELLPKRPLELGEPADPHGSAGVKRRASSLRLSPHYRALAAGRLRGQWETRGANPTRRRKKGQKKKKPHKGVRQFYGGV